LDEDLKRQIGNWKLVMIAGVISRRRQEDSMNRRKFVAQGGSLVAGAGAIPTMPAHPTDGNALSLRGVAIIATAIGAVAVGAFAIGALAIGRLAIRRVFIERAKLKSLEINDLTVTRIHAAEVIVSDTLTLPENVDLNSSP
jgi:hypothetical protein